MQGRIDIVHTNDGKKEKIRALIIGVAEFNKFMLRCTNSPSEAALNYQLETLGELAREAEVALNSLNVPVLDAVGPTDSKILGASDRRALIDAVRKLEKH